MRKNIVLWKFEKWKIAALKVTETHNLINCNAMRTISSMPTVGWEDYAGKGRMTLISYNKMAKTEGKRTRMNDRHSTHVLCCCV